MKKHGFFRRLMALLVLAALVAGTWYLLSARETIAPENPLNALNENSSHMLQQETIVISTESEKPAPEEPTPTPEATPTPEPETTPELTPAPTDTPEPEVTPAPSTSSEAEPTVKPTRKPPAQTPTPNPDAKQTKKPSQGQSNPDSNPLVTPKPGSTAQATAGTGENVQNTQIIYFTTSIINGATIPDNELHFTITHKQPSLKVCAATVQVNNAEIIQLRDRVYLADGQNSIKITVIYENSEGHQIQVSKTYTVFVVPEELIITTDLKDCTINQQSFSFTAYASIGSQKATLNAYVNGELISSASNRYKTTLQEGANEILLTADAEGRHIEQRFSVQVELPENVEFVTDLYDHEVDDPNFSFHAAITGGTQRASLTVVANGITLTGENDVYACELSRGNNLIRLKATDVDGKEYSQSYTIAYHRYVISESDSADETMPKLTCNLTNGQVVQGSMYTLQVAAKAGNGDRLYGDHITVQLNGSTLDMHWEDTSRSGYQLNLVTGMNDIVITIWDYEDRYTIYRYTIESAASEGGKIGTVTVAVEAHTVGLGYLVPPTQVDIFEGQNAVYPLAQVLEAKGFEYNYEGNINEGFYLAHLIKPGITNGYSIPEELEDLINEDGLMWSNSYHTDSLGEFDFSQASGWVYTVNDTNPSYNLAMCRLEDGDTLRLRFTLAYGKDVGGSNIPGNEGTYDQEW